MKFDKTHRDQAEAAIHQQSQSHGSDIRNDELGGPSQWADVTSTAQQQEQQQQQQQPLQPNHEEHSQPDRGSTDEENGKEDPKKPIAWRDLPRKQQLIIITLARLSEPLVQTSLQVSPSTSTPPHLENKLAQ